ncbi:transposase [Salmonella enterica]|nr:hypothetical protein [Salmonella enterica subsp. enterica serovar Pomona]EBS0892608.1 hypothetical protein [Salmonella enterica subsp. enterica serovar Abaetetuba]ECE0473381.1 hypothetical protein [Salmonella enterica subsp. enterica serovar Glostrup]EDA9947167.1 transposase [Salmonella enterica]EDB3637342.1 transposase [Salmonella enterica subsp. enterica serovar Oranienburg]
MLSPPGQQYNPYSESLFRTLKYCPWWPESGFHIIDDARSWVSRFANWYNVEHKHSGSNTLRRMNVIGVLM